jgi:hypothetical protein
VRYIARIGQEKNGYEVFVGKSEMKKYCTLLDLDMMRVSVKINRKEMNYWFSGVFVKLRKATFRFVVSLCPSTWITRLPLERFHEI